MTLSEMRELPVQSWAAKDSVMAMWVIDCHYETAMELGRAWGFAFNTVLFRWLKVSEDSKQLTLVPIEPPSLHLAQGYHTRSGGCEECWLFTRGNGLRVLRRDIRREFYDKRRSHSQKPDAVAQWIVDLYGDVPRLEMFARTRRPGWDVFGNEVDKFKAAE